MNMLNPFFTPSMKEDAGECFAGQGIATALNLAAAQLSTGQNAVAGFSKYVNEFLIPYALSVNYWTGVESERVLNAPPAETLTAYLELLEFNMDISARNMMGSLRAVNDYSNKEMQNAISAAMNTLLGTEGEDLKGFVERQAKMVEMVARIYPQAIRDIEPEYGFHFERGHNPLVAETDRFLLYQIVPSDETVEINPKGKPILILPPYVLGANILAFLPGDNRSYTHNFANHGIPTYIRILKDFPSTPALQVMTAEDDARDTRYFCERIMERHGRPVTLNGYCQGGFAAVCDLLSGELDGVVDALLTCVAPMDGTRSKGLSGFLGSLPRRFNDLAYGTKTLQNGNKVADGKLMGWVYKLKSIESEAPMVAFFRDLMMLRPKYGKTPKISKTAAALNYWLDNERTDLPLSITRMSFASYNTPITGEGTLPVKLFGRELNFNRLAEKKIPWLICYGDRDDLVEKETALAPLDFIDAEISPFPKGHVAIATSWSDPKSDYALHTRFGDKKQYRGPVRFQLDLDTETAPKAAPKKKGASKKS